MASPANGTVPFNKRAVIGFTTTPEERIGPGPPYSHPTLQVNLFFRVFLGFGSLFVSWVPARLLWRHGEFAGAVMCGTLLVINFMTLINALIWCNDDVKTWFAGYVLCDIEAYIHSALHTAFNNTMFEIMRSLAGKVALNRAVTPTRSERRRERIISALIIFTIPAIQIVMVYFDTVGRYNVATLVGCSAVYYPNWMYLVFYVLPTPVYAVLSGIMAVVTFRRYRKIDVVTRDVARSQDGVAAARQERVRMKLYFITLFCIIVFIPIVMFFFIEYIVHGAPWNRPYDFNALHFRPEPFNQYFISFTTSDMMPFIDLAANFVALLAGYVVFIPFGSTPEALNMYRKLLLAVGLGYFFPKLREEYAYRPKSRGTNKFSWATLSRSFKGGKSQQGTISTTSPRKEDLLPVTEQVSQVSRAERVASSSSNQGREFTTAHIEAAPWTAPATATSANPLRVGVDTRVWASDPPATTTTTAAAAKSIHSPNDSHSDLEAAAAAAAAATRGRTVQRSDAGGARAGVVRVETNISRRSMDLEQQR